MKGVPAAWLVSPVVAGSMGREDVERGGAMSTIRLGISTCLLGEPVRYDGGHKRDRFITDTLGQYVEFVPVCPETECGLGIPRESMHLAGNPASPRLVTTRTKVDHTDRMVAWARKRLEELEQEDLCGFIFRVTRPAQEWSGFGCTATRVCPRGRASASLPGCSWSTFPCSQWRRRGDSTIPSSGRILSNPSLP